MIKINRPHFFLAFTLAFMSNATFAEDLVVDVPADVQAEAPVDATTVADVPTDAPAGKQELIPQTADGDVVEPRVRKFNKPNRSQLHASVANQKAGYGFLEENQHKAGVVKLKSGLQYKVLKAGDGVKPTEVDLVACQYRGALIDGTVFEQSVAGKPASIKLAPLMPGLKEAIKLMSVGAKWTVYVPPALGFGAAGKPPKVGPDAVLVYDIELLAINTSALTPR